MENETDTQESLNPEGEADVSTTAPETEVESENEELKKAQELAQNYKIRAEKAETLAKQLQNKPEEKETPKNLSLKDIRALQDVSEEDVEEVIEFAKFKKISIAEAKKHPAVISLLKTKEEERKTAQATNTGGGKRATSKTTDEDLLARAETGQMPEDDDGIKRLAEARLAAKLKALENKT